MKKEKQKRYFCNLFNYFNNLKGLTKLIYCIIFLMVAIAMVALFTYLNFNYNPKITNNDWRSSYEYEKEQYTYLYDIFDTVIHEGEIPNVEAIPNGVFYKLNLTNDDRVFYYWIDSEIYSQSKHNMKITFSSDFKILDKECSVTLKSEDEYLKYSNSSQKLSALIYGLCGTLIIYSLLLLCLLISNIHKSIDTKLNNLDS